MPSKQKQDEKPLQDEDLLTDEEPPSINPYEILGIDEKATQEQVKSAYRKQALKHHPGKVAPKIQLSLIHDFSYHVL